MLPTPSFSHVNFENIYEPAEDSFLLLDTLSSRQEIEFLHNRFSRRLQQDDYSPSPLIVELGVGSGVVLAFVAANAKTMFGRSDVLTLGIDLNGFSCKAAAETVEKALVETIGNAGPRDSGSCATFLGSVNADLTESLRYLETDVLIFNPPYVPTENLPMFRPLAQSSNSSHSQFDRNSHLLALSYAGGEDGMEVTKRLLSSLPDTLHPKRGVAYILLCAQNRPESVKKLIRSWGSSWSVETVGRSGKSAGWEKLQVLRIWRV